MQKQALTVDPAIVGRYAAGGALAGGGTAALVNLVHMINAMRAEKKKRLTPTETDENTIVLTLPPKQADIIDKQVSSITGPKLTKTGPQSGEYALGRGPNPGQSRNSGSMKFGPKLCMGKSAAGTAGWPTLTASMLAALAGGAGGASLVNKLYEVQRERRLKADLEAAKQEYMDMLSGNAVKGASIIEDMFDYADNEKQAGDTFGVLNYPMAAMAILTILGSGATGYLTKRILDEKLHDAQGRSMDVPKVKRIVFRSAPESDPTKVASDDDRHAVAAGLMVMLDKVGGTTRFVDMPAVKTALDNNKITAQDLIKEAGDWDVLFDHLKTAGDLRDRLYDTYVKYTEKNPVKSFFKRTALKFPAVRRYADKKLDSALSGLRNLIPSSLQDKMSQDLATTLDSDVLSPLMRAGTTLFGGAAVGKMMDKSLTPQELAQLIVSAQEEAQQTKLLKDTKVPDTVQVGAQDPKAKTYLIKNQGKIQSIIKRLAAEGQI